MINILIIFFTQYSQAEKNDLQIKISTMNHKIQGWLMLFSKEIFVFPWTKWRGKNDLWAIISS
jgi:hypothetical protein